MEFKILKKSTKSQARLGLLKTAHGEVETPALVTVATQAVVKTLTAEEVQAVKSQLLICNTYHLHERPGEKIVSQAGGLHRFMNWSRPLLIDSGGFQVFSLGFGRDLGIGKVVKYFPGPTADQVDRQRQPTGLKIRPDGVIFKKPNGAEEFIGPKESIKIQEKLGADIIFAFDECTPPLSTAAYVQDSLERTHRWAKICLETHRRADQALFGIVQGSRFPDLRAASAEFIASLDFAGFGLGGDLGLDKKEMRKIIKLILEFLPERKPRHALGLGYLEDIKTAVELGVDTFDCTVPTHYARHGMAFTSAGRLNLRQKKFLKSKQPLDRRCLCAVCGTHRLNYLAHLIQARELTGGRLLTLHNLHFFNTFVERLRQKVKNNLY